jgi:hypothetical protein
MLAYKVNLCMKGGMSISTVQNIYSEIENDILMLNLKPGRLISENRLCTKYNVSRTPIRAVLSRLAGAGLVDIIPKSGSRVSMINMEIVKQIIYERFALESMVLKDYIAVATDSDIKKLEKTVIRLVKSYENTKNFKPDKFKEIDLSMHELWYKKTGHTYLWEQIRKSDSNYTRFCMLDMLECENYEHVILEHRQMYEVIKSRDTSKIEEIVKKHLYGGIERVNAALNNKFDEMFILY